ncbi:hypothetical protein Zmor_025900 [Zophobas morio]|uniref:Retinol dehydrogenase 11 n=1 Tax=Zophobas morio TaxID=2755281 RepID=A0AA38M456_9CUCU|nr:hypothetical protein Zmor_025900 [Zophobas morio]
MILFLPGFFLFIVIFCIFVRIYLSWPTRWCRSEKCLIGKTAVITGANTGIGYETALDFAKRGAKVILACRNKSKAEEARRKIIQETQNEKIFVRIVDMASFDSVRKFAKEMEETEDHIDILVNNAGAYGLEKKKTVDGHPLLMQVNYFSSFLLTNLVLDLLKKSTAGRIVNVSSMAGRKAGQFDVNKIDEFAPNNYDHAFSKLCNILFTIELAKRLRGAKVTTYSLHPGIIETGFYNNVTGLKNILFIIIIKLFSITREEGAQTPQTNIYCSVAKGIEKYNGEHFSCCQRVAPYKTATDAKLPQKLWEKTEKLVFKH